MIKQCRYGKVPQYPGSCRAADAGLIAIGPRFKQYRRGLDPEMCSSHSIVCMRFQVSEDRQPFQMAADPNTIVNSLHPSVVDKIDPEFARIYNLYQGSLDAQQTPGY